MAYGTSGVLDSLAAFDAQTVFDFGEDRLFDEFQRSLDAHNALVRDMVAPLVEFTNDRVRRYGANATLTMTEADEYTRADAQKVPPAGYNLGFPLKPFQISLQWTRKFLKVATVGELRAQMVQVQRADISNVRAQVQTALFKSTNNTAYVDRMIDGITIPLRALYNADSQSIPDDEYGNTFNAATHTHYLGTASFVAADVESALNTVIEHGVTGQLRIYINRAQEAAVIAMANFDPLPLPMLSPGGGSTADVVNAPAIRPFDVYNRMIGVWNGAVEVWVKSWVPASYVAVIEDDPSRRVLAFRTRPGSAGLGDLRLAAEDEKYPLRASTSEREFGISVWGRDQGAVLYTANATYAIPAFTA